LHYGILLFSILLIWAFGIWGFGIWDFEIEISMFNDRWMIDELMTD